MPMCVCVCVCVVVEAVHMLVELTGTLAGLCFHSAM